MAQDTALVQTMRGQRNVGSYGRPQTLEIISNITKKSNMSYLKTFRAEAAERLKLYRESADENKAERELLNWLGDKLLESYRNGQEGRKGK